MKGILPVVGRGRLLCLLTSVAVTPVLCEVTASAQTVSVEKSENHQKPKVKTTKSQAPKAQDNLLEGENITVSATRRKQSTHDVADSVTVLTGKDLQKIGAQSFKDYISQIPGANFNATVPGISTVTFRGISTTAGLDQGQGTTGYFLNDIPLTEPGFAIAIPDIDTFDVARVEGLRGPQSTLFGSATLGGALDYIPNEADSKKWDGAAESSILGMPGHEVGYAEKGMVNIPIIKGKLAVRGVLDYRQDPGYIDNIGNGRNSNTTYTRNARASVVWTPTDDTKLSYTYLGQSTNVSDDPYSMSDEFGAYTKSRTILEPVHTQLQMHELRLDHTFNFATLTAMASFMRKGQSSVWDYTPYYVGVFPGLSSPTYAPQNGDSKSMYYEVRLTSNSTGRFSWLIGAAYYDTWKRINAPAETPGIQNYLSNIYGSGLASKMVMGTDDWGDANASYDGTEKAIFGEMSYHFPHHITVTGGARVFNMSETSSTELWGYSAYAAYGSLYHHTSGVTSQTSALPKGAIRWEPNKQIMVYGLVSEGYRFGAPNTNNPNPLYKTPAGTSSDSLVNWEVGSRLNLLNNRLILEPTFFLIDWSNMQARLTRPDGITYGANVGEAISKGAEFSGTWFTPVPGFSIKVNGTYTDAHTIDTTNLGNGAVIPKNSQLASSPKWQFSEILSYRIPGVAFHPQFTLVHHYVGSSPGLLNNAFRIGNYNTIDLRFSGDYRTRVGTTTLSVYVNNVNGSRGVTMGYISGAPSLNDYYLVQPRSIGMTLGWHL